METLLGSWNGAMGETFRRYVGGVLYSNNVMLQFTKKRFFISSFLKKEQSLCDVFLNPFVHPILVIV